MSEPFPGDAARAAPYRGKSLRVITIDLNKPLPPEAHSLTPVTGFALHPALGVSAANEKGVPVAPGTLVIVCKKNSTLVPINRSSELNERAPRPGKSDARRQPTEPVAPPF